MRYRIFFRQPTYREILESHLVVTNGVVTKRVLAKGHLKLGQVLGFFGLNYFITPILSA
jgi:hypothetical protein